MSKFKLEDVVKILPQAERSGVSNEYIGAIFKIDTYDDDDSFSIKGKDGTVWYLGQDSVELVNSKGEAKVKEKLIKSMEELEKEAIELIRAKKEKVITEKLSFLIGYVEDAQRDLKEAEQKLKDFKSLSVEDAFLELTTAPRR